MGEVSNGSGQSLRGEVAIVTGGTRGIGRATVELFRQEGASVLFCGRNDELGRQLQEQYGEDVAFALCDVADAQQVESMVKACCERFGAPTVLVNNAGVNANFDAVEMTEEQWDRFFGIDLKASWLTAKHVLPHMRSARRGSIVNVSSIHGFVTLEGFFPYAAAKSGLIGLTRSLALDYGRYGVRVNAVCPGFTRTRLVQESIDRSDDGDAAERTMIAGVALGRIAEPAEIAAVVRFFASQESSYVTGSALVVDGGLTARRAG